MRWRDLSILLIFTVLIAAACDDGAVGPGDAGPADAGDDGGAPDATSDADGDADGDTSGVPEWEPGQLDSGYEVAGLLDFYLIGNDLTPASPFAVTVTVPAGTSGVVAWVDDTAAGALAGGGTTFELDGLPGGVGPGEHHLILAVEGSDRAFAALPFITTHPLYVVVTNDWDDPDNPNHTYNRQEDLHEWHPELRLTHFVGPYTFTDPDVTDERREEIVSWLLDMREVHGDEIGLHIHPYCSFVEAAGLTCRTSPSFAYATGDRTGYTIYLSEYDEEETVLLLETADALFTDWGLNKPTSFRAGGWTAELHTLRALARAGHVADTSAMNWARLEEWEGYPGADLYDWNRDQWSTIDETSQPYYPSQDDILSSEPPLIPILEVPDNGLLVDYVDATEMIEMFEANWSGGALTEPTQYSIGYHPPNFGLTYQTRIDDTLTHIDGFLASNGDGPVVYATLSEMALVWPFPGE